ncbi:UDP-galactopyranose mutase [Lachnospiraceae bacterium G11]|nr:UDP-galactopyranose mutase [Lachnospiraceae bacterium G11]
MHYDYLIVGAGLYGATFANIISKQGRTCLVIEKKNHIGGNVYTKNINGINVHMYGAHIFHTSDEEVWNYVNQFADFNNYINSPIANFKGELYHLPFNMNTFKEMWGVETPEEAKKIIEEQRAKEGIDNPTNLEEQALSLVGRDIYEKLIKGYTEKQWGRDCKDLPSFIIRRLPLRFEYNNNYFNDKYQGIPIGGYTGIIEKMLEGIEVRLGTDYKTFLANEAAGKDITFDLVLYTGPIDEYFDYKLGQLEFRSLCFKNEILSEVDDYQGNAVMNYTDRETPYTRIIEHKHFEFNKCKGTVVTKEYPAAWKPGDEPYYPINDERNNALYEKYRILAEKEEGVIFGGRLGSYKYYDMDKVIAAAIDAARAEL